MTTPDRTDWQAWADALTTPALVDRLRLAAAEHIAGRPQREALLRTAAARLAETTARADDLAAALTITTDRADRLAAAPTPARLEAGDELELELPDGSTLHLWAHHCEHCTSVDAWRTRPGEIGPDPGRTGDDSRLAVGWFGMRAGSRFRSDALPLPGSAGWPAVTTSVLVWEPAR